MTIHGPRYLPSIEIPIARIFRKAALINSSDRRPILFTCERTCRLLCARRELQVQNSILMATTLIVDKTNNVLPIYSSLFGKSLVLPVVLRKCYVPLPCSIIDESMADVRIRIKPGWEVNVRKELILAVEEYVVARDNWIN
jgi:hypothetical protein